MGIDAILAAVDELPDSQQESLIDIIRKRLIEKRRKEIAANAELALNEFQSEKIRPVTSDELIKRLHCSIQED